VSLPLAQGEHDSREGRSRMGILDGFLQDLAGRAVFVVFDGDGIAEYRESLTG